MWTYSSFLIRLESYIFYISNFIFEVRPGSSSFQLEFFISKFKFIFYQLEMSCLSNCQLALWIPLSFSISSIFFPYRSFVTTVGHVHLVINICPMNCMCVKKVKLSSNVWRYLLPEKSFTLLTPLRLCCLPFTLFFYIYFTPQVTK